MIAQKKDPILIVEFGMGNTFSLSKVIERLGFTTILSSSVEDIYRARKIILPGVGHFGTAMHNLRTAGMITALNKKADDKEILILGICLGMQLMSRKSEEGNVPGLGWFSADVLKIAPTNHKTYKVPHVGFNSLRKEGECRLLKEVNEEDEFYFLHSYRLVPDQSYLNHAWTLYETPFISVIECENIFGVQFHPELSKNSGAKVLRNFLSA